MVVTGIGDDSGGVVVYWEMVRIEVVATPGGIMLYELEPLRVSEFERPRLRVFLRLRLNELKRLGLSEFARLGLNELEPLRVSENDLEPLAEVEGARGGVVVDWEMVSKEVVTNPRTNRAKRA